jgi:predicted metal-dependent phosphoesterase TrpH
MEPMQHACSRARRTASRDARTVGAAVRRRHGAARGIPAAALALALSACAALPWPRAQVPGTLRTASPERELDLRGVAHVHTRASHDSSGTPAELLEGARGAGLDWVALTEHTRPGELPPSEGRLEGVRLIPGYELSFAGGSVLALGLRDVSDALRGAARAGDAPAVVREIRAAGAIAVVGHLEEIAAPALALLREVGLDGVEIVNLHAAARRHPWRLALGQLALPSALGLRALAHVDADVMARHAALGAPGGVVAGVDAHAKLRVLGPLGGTLDRYGDLFRLVTTHVLAADDSAEAILQALRSGRSYIAFETLARVDRAGFGRTGDRFALTVPQPARLALVCDGAQVADAQGTEVVWSLPEGASRCHGEAWLRGRRWIVTSAVSAAR